MFLSLKQLFTSAVFSTESINQLRLLLKQRYVIASSPFSVQLFQNIREFGKKYFTDHRTADKIQSFVVTNGNFSGLFFF